MMEHENMDITNLSLNLKQEKLFVESEKQQIKSLNEEVLKSIERVHHSTFVRGEERRIYNDLILRPDSSLPSSCCQKSNLLSQLKFVDGYQVLGHNEPLFAELLNGLRTNPKLSAQCLVISETIGQDVMLSAAHTFFCSIYSSCLSPKDEHYLLLLLKNLIELQVVPSDNPRRMLHKGSCAFSQLYKIYVDNLPQAKVFLTAALYEPIMHLLMEDELFLDIDITKAIFRFPPEERLQRFGQEGTPEYNEAASKYRLWIIKKLVKNTKRFISCIKEAMHCFPPTLAWLVRSIYEILIAHKPSEVKEINSICIDIIFDLFLCSAIVTPEPNGISDAPISHISRFNLIQVAQTLKVLAMNPWENPDPRFEELYSNFDKEVMSVLVDSILSGRGLEGPPITTPIDSSSFAGLAKLCFLIPEKNLYVFIDFLTKSLQELPEAGESHKSLESFLSPLKRYIQPIQSLYPCLNSSAPLLQNSSSHNSLNENGAHSSSPVASPKKNLLTKVKQSRRQRGSHYSENIETEDLVTNHINGLNNHSPLKEGFEMKVENILGYDTVLSVSLNTNSSVDYLGMMPEEKFIQSLQTIKPPSRVRIIDDDGTGVSGSEGTIEKRTRFSLSHDEGSIGNTSDNLEAISEAASNHSVSSSLDDVEQADQPDNLSDMVSANVSGRGTPNVSGRDTPLSQVTDGDEGCRGAEAPIQPPNIPVTIAKPGSADIEEKFGRFEIKPIIAGDETVSLVSDTWSTDVLASDSETIEATERDGRNDELQAEFLDQHLKELDLMHGTGSNSYLRGEACGETFETASEAWSTDVLASDSERLTEFDTDDAHSVARSDDTGRSEIEVELSGNDLVRLETSSNHEENVTPRVLESRSPIENENNRDENQEGAVALSTTEPSGAEINWNSSKTVKKEASVKQRKLIPVMQITNGHIASPISGFRPINEFDNISNDIDESILRQNHPELSETQTLGRLSFSLIDLPNNGILNADQPLLVNDFILRGKGKCEEKVLSNKDEKSVNKDSKRKTSDGHPKIVSVGSSAEDSSIHLSTASLASSSSSGSDAPHSAFRDQKRLISDSNASSTREHLSLTNTLSAPPMNVVSTGAIPKSISFDKTAEKGDRECLDGGDPKHKRGFFKGFKLPGFKGRRKVMTSLNSRSDDYPLHPYTDVGIRRSSSEESRRPILEESSDDILAKYRKKPVDISEVDGSLSIDNLANDLMKSEEEDSIDLTSTEVGSYAFNDAKRKLRIVLSSSDFCILSHNGNSGLSSNTISYQCYDINTWLRMQLAEAKYSHNRPLVAQIHETLRCVSVFDQQGKVKLLQSLKEDYQQRMTSYVNYLTRSKQSLLNTVSYLEKLHSRLQTDCNIIMDSMVNMCVRMFLEKREEEIKIFANDFTKLTVSDEKVNLVKEFLAKLYEDLDQDPMWSNCTNDQLFLAQISLERAIMTHVYLSALYPNGDADVSRDKVLKDHMTKLCGIVSPIHKDLRIPKIYHFECPWPSAQAELSYLGSYKTAEDKLMCVVRTSQTIMNLLSMAHENSVPAADDFIPVMVYVIIKATPPAILSTIQYVNLFYEDRLKGENEYWWTQFCSAVEFIKTMDYNL